MQPYRALWGFAVGLLCCAAAFAQSPFAPKVSGPLSQRVVAYQIDAKYDPAKHTVNATETLTYHNLTGQPLDRFPFHLYLNAFQPKSTWIHEAHRDGNFRTSRVDEWKPEDYGANDVTSFEVVGMGDLTKQMKFVLSGRRQSRRQDRLRGEVAAPDPARAGCAVQNQVQGDLSRSDRAHRIQAHLPARRAVVSQGRGVVARSMELSSVPRPDRVLCRLRHL